MNDKMQTRNWTGGKKKLNEGDGEVKVQLCASTFKSEAPNKWLRRSDIQGAGTSAAASSPTSEQTGFVKRTDVPVNTAVPPVRPAAGDSAPTGTAQQFAGINKSLIVWSPEVWSEGNKDKV